MEKKLFFDAGPVITLVTSRLAWLLPLLKKQFNGTFYITPAVKFELIDRPLTVKRFEFEALEVSKMIKEGIMQVYDKVPKKRVEELQTLANSSFSIKEKNMDILQSGELESLACTLETNADAIVMDERTLRLFIENSGELKNLLQTRFQSSVAADTQKMKQFVQAARGVTIIRSIELVGVAYRMGLLKEYVPAGKEGRDILVDSVLWATRFNGCAVTEHEIDEIKGFLLK